MAEELARKQGGRAFQRPLPRQTCPTPRSSRSRSRSWRSRSSRVSCSARAGALGREFLDRSVHDSRALQNEFEMPVLGEIPRIQRA